MKTTKRFVATSFNDYKTLEKKLEAYASKGLILKKKGLFFGNFEKTQPQNLKYAIAFFGDDPVFNPQYKENKQNFFDYAKAAGWDFVCASNQMQIFSSSLENPASFDTDATEQLNHIHRAMKKSLIPSQMLMLLAFLFNFIVRFDDFRNHPARFLSSNMDLLFLLMTAIIILSSSSTLIDYYLWYFRCKKFIALGGTSLVQVKPLKRYLDYVYLICLNIILIFMIASISLIRPVFVISTLGQLPFCFLICWISSTILKRCKYSARTNKIISSFFVLLGSLVYFAFIFHIIDTFDLEKPSNNPYTLVQWTQSKYGNGEYRLYHDDLPLTCEDLYGPSDFQYYSYEANTEKSPLLHITHYEQTSPPMQDGPPELSYQIYIPQFDFVKNLVIKDLIQIPEWSDLKLQRLDNAIFSTQEAYTFYDTDLATQSRGNYVLVYDNKIIHFIAEKPLDDAQIKTVKEKLVPLF